MTKKKSIIGISGSIIVDNGGNFPGYERAYVNYDYAEAVILAGGAPFIIPVVCDEDVVRAQLQSVDALILSGGHDPNPLLYGEEPSLKHGEILPKRDTFDFLLMKVAMEMKKPILGICRGHQIVNIFNGGSLYQDISFIEEAYIKHNQQMLPSEATHTVLVEKESKLKEILGDFALVNSFHHLSIKDVAPGFKISAISKDGVIEAIEKEGDHFVMGVQWHPEMMAKNHENMLKIFKRLVEESENNKNN
ncbi:gamma-glutamyl-gamma-aminobutyrate hydrolase family protein [Clostridium tarantellae]|uniref:Gamma-glutamyl-gamma-aminobutyrate hydrolase family protein n=1 Tax=Clostridium tarantellae TaxID=39493 RepID=A0A6I1MJM6_9CLOT|nr:gamma-glutamyl-gamma-aminobutyrate hydrolase family protein [Clostridium tarantellae]MPQ43290.1 gamma-glutamyl-gamma-aminobutyrate hydrolase family protein [Clostridium tarantellae]